MRTFDALDKKFLSENDIGKKVPGLINNQIPMENIPIQIIETIKIINPDLTETEQMTLSNVVFLDKTKEYKEIKVDKYTYIFI